MIKSDVIENSKPYRWRVTGETADRKWFNHVYKSDRAAADAFHRLRSASCQPLNGSSQNDLIRIMHGDKAMNAISEQVAQVIGNALDAEYRRNRQWNDAKDVIEGMDCGVLANAAIEEISRQLSDPVNVHINTLHGKIAKMTPEMVRHVYPELFAAE